MLIMVRASQDVSKMDLNRTRFLSSNKKAIRLTNLVIIVNTHKLKVRNQNEINL